jgi:hypothetical protein
MKKQICGICGNEYNGYGNNPHPVETTHCCDECNVKAVIPARIKELEISRIKDLKENQNHRNQNR